MAFGKPFVHDGAGESSEPAGQFDVRQAAPEKIVNRANRNAEPRGEFPLRLVFLGI